MEGGQLRDVAFQVLRNGRSICTAGLGGRPGVITAILDRVAHEGRDYLSLHVGALDSATEQHTTWARQPLRVGDEVVVRVVANVKPTRVRFRIETPKLYRQDQEKVWLRKIAKKHGYKLVKR